MGSLVGIGVDFGIVKLTGYSEAYWVCAANLWKWIYVILASCRLFAGLAIMSLLLITPMKVWFLIAQEKYIAVCCVISNNTGIYT